jgi:hypothetical protein
MSAHWPGGRFPRVDRLEDYFDPARFRSEQLRPPMGVAGVWSVEELATGRAFLLKRTLPRAPDARHELLVADLLQATTDRDVPAVEWAAPGRRDAVVIQHAGTLPGVDRLLGEARKVLGPFRDWGIDGSDALAAQLNDPMDPLRFLVADFVTDQVGRYLEPTGRLGVLTRGDALRAVCLTGTMRAAGVRHEPGSIVIDPLRLEAWMGSADRGDVPCAARRGRGRVGRGAAGSRCAAVGSRC